MNLSASGLHERLSRYFRARGLFLARRGPVLKAHTAPNRLHNLARGATPWIVCERGHGTVRSIGKIHGLYPNLETVAAAYGVSIEVDDTPRIATDEEILAAFAHPRTIGDASKGLGYARGGLRHHVMKLVRSGVLTVVLDETRAPAYVAVKTTPSPDRDTSDASASAAKTRTRR